MDWDVFISHAWEDKEAIARPLAKALEAQGLHVWFDEFTLSVGDRLRRSIDRGLVGCRYGIVILSPHFFAKEWPQKELDGLVQREYRGEKVILPVWHNVTAEEIRAYSPLMADRIAVSTSRGVDHVVAELLRAMHFESESAGPQTPHPKPVQVPVWRRKLWAWVLPSAIVLLSIIAVVLRPGVLRTLSQVDLTRSAVSNGAGLTSLTPDTSMTATPTATLRSTELALVSTGVPTRSPTPSATPQPTVPLVPTSTQTLTATVEPSVTLGPSATPSATPTPAPMFTVDQPTVNVRTGPGIAYPAIGVLRQGEFYEITGRNQAGDWWQFAYLGQKGWVRKDLVTDNNQSSDVAVIAVIPVLASPSPTAVLTAIVTALPPTSAPVASLPAPLIRMPACDKPFDPGGQPKVHFDWDWNGPPLTSNQGFEVRIWREDQPEHYGATGPVPVTYHYYYLGPGRGTAQMAGGYVEVSVWETYAVQRGGPGHYYWTVAVVQKDPYSRIGPEATPCPLQLNVRP